MLGNRSVINRCIPNPSDSIREEALLFGSSFHIVPSLLKGGHWAWVFEPEGASWALGGYR
jgi:hypothetical protein